MDYRRTPTRPPRVSINKPILQEYEDNSTLDRLRRSNSAAKSKLKSLEKELKTDLESEDEHITPKTFLRSNTPVYGNSSPSDKENTPIKSKIIYDRFRNYVEEIKNLDLDLPSAGSSPKPSSFRDPNIEKRRQLDHTSEKKAELELLREIQRLQQYEDEIYSLKRKLANKTIEVEDLNVKLEHLITENDQLTDVLYQKTATERSLRRHLEEAQKTQEPDKVDHMLIERNSLIDELNSKLFFYASEFNTNRTKIKDLQFLNHYYKEFIQSSMTQFEQEDNNVLVGDNTTYNLLHHDFSDVSLLQDEDNSSHQQQVEKLFLFNSHNSTFPSFSRLSPRAKFRAVGLMVLFMIRLKNVHNSRKDYISKIIEMRI